MNIIISALYFFYLLCQVTGHYSIFNFGNFLNDILSRSRAMADLENQDNLVNFSEEYDFIIVGAGTAGCALAARLSEVASWKILLLEAGGPEQMFMEFPLTVNALQTIPTIDWGYRTQPSEEFCLAMKGNQCRFPRGKVMGGSSVLNFMIYTRGNRKDFDNWSQLGNYGWSYDDVLPYFKKLEDCQIPNSDEEYAGLKGPVRITQPLWHSKVSAAFVQAALEEGSSYVDYNGKDQIGVSYVKSTTDQSYRWSSNRVYLYPLKGKRPNLHIRKYSFVKRILIDPQTKKAYGVLFESQGKSFEIKARLEVISSAGAINTPQLLMLSGVGPAKHLREIGIEPLANLPVGYNLQDHIASPIHIATNETTLKIEDFFTLDNWLKLQSHNSKLSIPGGVEALGFYQLDPTSDSDKWPDIELVQLAGSLSTNPATSIVFGLKDDIDQRLSTDIANKNNNVFVLVPMLLRPRSKGRLLLRSKNPRKHPLIYPNFLKDPYDLQTILRGIKKIMELLEQPAMLQINATILQHCFSSCCHYGDVTTKAYWECYIRHFTMTIYHVSGTAKMGPKHDKSAVVDPRLRVYGIENLRVVDASIMPAIVAGHPNSAVYMIAEKAADMIKQDYGIIK
ncbi:glucose dehydrogenase [FAD, quinone]-like [Haematobia irritans]|uniref:glucose dehydrogenase [FAD, quinone]-like n=1 Tax=Haematobia irritans TaxID=7368 RepID=UPI003F4F4FD2